MGLAGRAFGLTLDRVTSMDVVTADGRRRRVDEDDDLFWALRGGGGSFAIVTAVRLRTRTVDRAAFFRISYPRGARAEALADWDALRPHGAQRADRDPHARRQRRERLRPVPRLRIRPQTPDRPPRRNAHHRQRRRI